ncbi:hypothetical protein Agub_g13979 [Astrephomene gubernaculifera]|uniref:Protein kinase domain-containing protein n=1 Tax=Astrephomene gubernaculifera TaxID=47775 RepID=A0AAD3HRX2_9CHLO|nr:hypothetical protein Agub_g13979 [Astrephomene gubernaculifera]
MKFLSCLFGGGLQREAPNACPVASFRQGEQPVEVEARFGPPRSHAELMAPAPRTPSGTPAVQHTDIQIRELREVPGAATTKSQQVQDAERGETSLTADLLQGLFFTDVVLGYGSFGIVVKGFLDGKDVAVKFVVTHKPADRAAVREITVGPSQALVHPHICKTYSTRSAVLTHRLIRELRNHVAEIRTREARQKQMLRMPPQQQQPQPTSPSQQRQQQLEQQLQRRQQQQPPQPGRKGGEGQGAGKGGRGAGAAITNHLSNPMQPLTAAYAASPRAVLFEMLSRLGAYDNQVVTLVIMEHCCRGTLTQAIHGGCFAAFPGMWSRRTAVRALIRTAAELARALLHLHRGGLVHGDLKPSNVLLKVSREDRRGFTIKLGDFGHSHVLPAGAKSLDTSTWGTPAYMAPEALSGRVGKASDVWSFGVILSEALTRTHPYGEDIELDRLVLGILDGSLQLAWPRLKTIPIRATTRSDGDGSDGDGAGGDGGCTVTNNAPTNFADGAPPAAMKAKIRLANSLRNACGDTTASASGVAAVANDIVGGAAGGVASGVSGVGDIGGSPVAVGMLSTASDTVTAATIASAAQPQPFSPDNGFGGGGQTAATNAVGACTSPTNATNFTLLTTNGGGAGATMASMPTNATVTAMTNDTMHNSVAAAAAARRLHYGHGAAVEGWDVDGGGAAVAAKATAAAAVHGHNTSNNACIGGGGAAVGNGNNGSNGNDDELNSVEASLVDLGRRCTNPVAADRPCFAAILGELIDLELLMKSASKGNRQPNGGGGAANGNANGVVKDSGSGASRNRSRFCFAAAAADQLRQSRKDARRIGSMEGECKGGQDAGVAVARAEAALGPA